MSKKVYYIPEGLANIKSLFPELNFNEIKKWSVVALNASEQVIAESRINEIGCCCNEREKVRVHFVNDIGEIDTINFQKAQIEDDIKSDTWEKSLKFPLNKTKGGVYRTNITASEVYEVETKCYPESAQKWIDELARTNLAWMEIKDEGLGLSTLMGGSNQNLIPILISDMKFPIRKNKNRYEYIVQLKFTKANRKNTKRS